jgi:hypothetical protein
MDDQVNRLINAIQSARRERLEETIISMVISNGTARQLVDEALLVPEETPFTVSHTTGYVAHPLSAGTVHPMYPVGPSMEPHTTDTCQHCHQEFDALNNVEGACSWHTGTSSSRVSSSGLMSRSIHLCL